MTQRDEIGTIRFEQHDDDGGYSIWAKVGVCIFDSTIGDYRIAGSWVNVYSSAIGNPGLTAPSNIIEDEDISEVIGSIPGTPAAQKERS